MAGEFTHIHCSSRFDRSATDLETDIDNWMEKSSLITMTEVGNNSHASRLREKGWSYFNAPLGAGRDDCAVAWKSDDFHKLNAMTRKLSDEPYSRLHNQPPHYLFGAMALLRHVHTGNKILVAVSHFPAHLEGKDGWKTTDEQWRARKAAYLSGLKNWSTLIRDLEHKHHPEATLITADWNMNAKHDWVQTLMDNHWGKQYQMAWRHFPTSGGSMSGGAQGPAGAPGKGKGDRIIDWSLIRGLKVTDGPDLMNRVRSSDHRPFTESLRFLAKGETNPHPGHTGDVQKYPSWWGFGDNMDDEIYAMDYSSGSAGGEVL